MKKPLLLLHGALGAAKQFKTWEPIFSSWFDVHSFDWFGHGNRASETKSYSINGFAEQLHDYILAQKFYEKPLVFGYSMGGYVALTLESLSPNYCEKILTIGTKFNWNPDSAAHETKFLQPDKILEKIPKYAEYLVSLHGEDWKNVLKRTAEMMLALGNSPVLSAERLQQCSTSVRFCVGDHDTMVSVEETYLMYKNTPNASFQVLPNTPHPVDKLRPEAIAHFVNDFLLDTFQ